MQNQHERKSPRSLQLRTRGKQTVATDHQAPESLAAEIQFRENLWREYRLEAINAGFNIAQATEYASAVSSGNGSSRKYSRNGACWTQLVLSEPAQGGKANRHLRSHHAYAMGKEQNHRANRSRRRL